MTVETSCLILVAHVSNIHMSPKDVWGKEYEWTGDETREFPGGQGDTCRQAGNHGNQTR